jgi:hypothetical protein
MRLFSFIFRPQMLDIVAAAQTTESHNAAVEILDFESEDIVDLPERYLWSLSFGSQPLESVIRGKKNMC